MALNNKHRMGIGFTLALIMMLEKNVSGQTTTKSEEAPFDFQSNLKAFKKVLFPLFIGVNGLHSNSHCDV